MRPSKSRQPQLQRLNGLQLHRLLSNRQEPKKTEETKMRMYMKNTATRPQKKMKCNTTITEAHHTTKNKLITSRAALMLSSSDSEQLIRTKNSM